MCVLFSPEVVISNAFYAKNNGEGSCMDVQSLQNFCSIIHTKIASNIQITPQHKYVYFKVDEDDVADFCRSNAGFVRGINKVYSVKKIDQSELARVNAVYTEEIQRSLEDARKAFAAQQ